MPTESFGHGSHSEGEVTKLQHRLQLLRQEYVKIQTRLAEVERDYAILAATTKEGQGPNINGKNFVAEILKKISDLFNKQAYSDFKIRLEHEVVFCHKLVLSARNPKWASLEDDSTLDWSHIPNQVSLELLKWCYTNHISLSSTDDAFKLDLMRTAKSFNLMDLVINCERALMATVDVKNCIRFYTTADDIGAEELKSHCSKLISAHWDDFSSEDFEHMTAPLLFTMFKTKTKFPLHSAIRLKREDVVFLYLIENSLELGKLVNQPDDKGHLPLDLALSSCQEELATTLLEHKADVNVIDSFGLTLLHRAVARNDEFSSIFLCNHGAHVNVSTPESGDTPLHLAAKFETMKTVAEKLIALKANPNAQNDDNWTPIHVAIQHNNPSVFQLLLANGVDLEIRTSEGYPALWYALKHSSKTIDQASFATCLVQKGASTNTVCGNDGNSLLSLCALESDEDAAIFLVNSGAAVDHTNRRGESALHIAALTGLDRLIRKLLEEGANPNLQTTSSGTNGNVFRQSPLHLAVENRNTKAIHAILRSESKTKPNLNLKNSAGQTPLALALVNEMEDIALDLLRGGANVDVLDLNGMTLLHSAILDQNSKVAIFLLNNGADVNIRTDQGETCLELSIKKSLTEVVESLCRLGADMSASSSETDSPLWISLDSNHEEIASILVRYGVDVDGWADSPDGYSQSLLHRAINENRIEIAKFLIRAGCDLNSPRKQGRDGRGGDEAHDLASPLHLCCQWGLEDVVQTLLEHGASINAKDVEGKTALHHAIENGHQGIIGLILDQPGLDLSSRDKSGLSPFAAAMTFRNNLAAKRILQMEPLAAEQYDNRGRNFLHTAILKDDLESVLFLLSIHVNVHSRTQDANNQLTPLLLAVQKGNEMIVRNLILAGASVTDTTNADYTSLHLAAESNLANICSILLSNNVNYSAVDSRGNNALQLAVKEGHLEATRVLLTESQIDAEATNNKGRNPLHILANFGQENSVSIFDLFVECMPNYPINRPDAEGNTPLLLAYTKGNGALCRSLVKSGAILGTMNHQGVSIFNYQVATKQLLYRLLDFLSQEPKWGEGDLCEECNTKFGITTRKHHCRHCGRLLCSKCSDKDMPILKYNLTKPVRVCDICADVLTVGPSIAGN